MSSSLRLKEDLELNIRWAEVADSKAISEVELASGEYENRKEPFNLTCEEFTQIWTERLSGTNFRTILACHGTQLYGFLTFENSIKLGHVLALYIDPAYMRKGIGRILIEVAAELVLSQGGSSLEVDVEVGNQGGLEFYKNLGFKKIGLLEDHLYLMRKTLSKHV